MLDRARRFAVVSTLLFLAWWAIKPAVAAPRTVRSAAALIPVDRIDHRTISAPELPATTSPDAPPVRQHRRLQAAVPIAVDLNTDRDGTWEPLPDGGSLWRLRITSPGARFLSFKLADHEMEAGSELYFVSVHHDFAAGPFDERHNRIPRRFGSPMVPGDSAIVELYLPAAVQTPRFDIESVSYGFHDPLQMAAIPLRSEALPGAGVAPDASVPLDPQRGPFSCQRDINCPEGGAYQDEKRAAAEGYDGTYICSGQMINNVRRDNRYLYLTAAHCEWFLDPAGMVYYWNYENSGCGTNDAPFVWSTGSTDLYHDIGADIDLLELHGADLESDHGVYFLGWEAAVVTPSSGATIGFPEDKPKQIAIDDGPVIDCTTGPCPDGFGTDFWRVDGWEVGVTQVGSSGGGLLDQRHRLVGVLTGGVGTSCDDFEWDEFAQLHPSWNQLAQFLDPDATGTLSIPGKNAEGPPPVADGVVGTAARFGRGAGDRIDVIFDGSTCVADHAVVLWGTIGDWSGYVGDVGTQCDFGSSGVAGFDFPAADAWFNILWVGSDDAAGPAGSSSSGPRSWAATGLCGVTADDFSDPVCD